MPVSSFLVLRQIVEPRLDRKSRGWLKSASKEIADGAPDARFCALVSEASRHARQRTPLAPDEDERTAVQRACPRVEIERWSLLEALRVAVLLSRPDLGEESGAVAVEEVFRFADEGESCALYRSLAFLPGPERFLSRAREGCRSNMQSVFEAAALDTPYPVEHFDELAWNQAAIKALFIGAPLWRMVGVDERLSEELCRMALDLSEERRSAGRPVQPELWMLLGEHGGERALVAIQGELDDDNADSIGRSGAALALARRGETEELAARKETEADPRVALTMADALAGRTDQTAYARIQPTETVLR